MSSNQPTTSLPGPFMDIESEYTTAYKWRGFPPNLPQVAPYDKQEVAPVDKSIYETSNRTNYIQYRTDAYQKDTHHPNNKVDNLAPVDPDIYNTTNGEAYKNYGEDAYKRQPEKEDAAEDEQAPVDPNMYKTSSGDAYKNYGEDAYKRQPEQEDAAEDEQAPVDPDMYKTSSGDAYKNYGEDAYKRQPEQEDAAEDEQAPVDPDMYKTSSGDAYKNYGEDAYKRQPEQEGDERKEQAIVDPDMYRSQYAKDFENYGEDAYKRQTKESLSCVPPLDLTSVEKRRKTGSMASSTVRSGKTRMSAGRSARCLPIVETARRRSCSEALPTGTSCCDTGKVRETPRVSVVPDIYRSTAQSDYGPPPSVPDTTGTAVRRAAEGAPTMAVNQRAADGRSFTSEYVRNYKRPPLPPVRVPVSCPTVCVHHVDPSFYTSTTQAAYPKHNVSAPHRDAYTRPIVAVRHVDASMYVTSNEAAFGGR